MGRNIWEPAHVSFSLPSSIKHSSICSLLSIISKKVVHGQQFSFLVCSGPKKQWFGSCQNVLVYVCPCSECKSKTQSKAQPKPLIFLGSLLKPCQTSPTFCQKSLPTLVKMLADFNTGRIVQNNPKVGKMHQPVPRHSFFATKPTE